MCNFHALIAIVTVIYRKAVYKNKMFNNVGRMRKQDLTSIQNAILRKPEKVQQKYVVLLKYLLKSATQ